MKKIAVLIILVAALVLAYHFSWIRFPSEQERRVQKQLDEFHTLTQANDSKKIGEALNRFISDDGNIDLTVHFGPDLGQENPNISPEHFSKDSFVRFIDSVLYSLDQYGYQARIKEFTLSPDKKSATITFSSHEWGEGKSYSAGLGVNMRFASETTCTGSVDLSSEQPRLAKASCQSHLESFPKQK